MYADYDCPKCKHNEFIQKPYGKEFDWPEDVECPTCNDGSLLVRQRGQIGDISIGYHDGIMYTPSKYVPMNSLYGAAGRTLGVEGDSE